MDTKIPIYEAKILGTDNTGIFAISFVDYPANERNFVALNKMKPVKLSLDKHKQVLTGVVLIPDQLIYRYDQNLGEYYLKFTAQDIEKIANKMMRTGIALSTTTHQHEKPLRGNYLTELWIVADPKKDKAVALGLGELPAGTLVASYKINDPNYWRTEVLTGNVKGFSLEGLFNFNSVKMKKTTKPATPAPSKANGVVSFLKSVTAMLEGDTVAEADALATEAAKDEVGAGDPFLIFELADGSEIYVDPDGYATLDDEQAPAGEHALTDGNFIVIDDTGMMVVTQPEADATDPAKAADPVAMKKKQDAAKARAKALLAKQGDPKTTEIAKLKKRLAELEKEPSTPKAKPAVPGTEKAAADMTYTEKMAAVIKSRRDRMEAKRKPAAE
jgi:hypothetical protein